MSPRGWMSFESGGAVGLGIVANLNKPIATASAAAAMASPRRIINSSPIAISSSAISSEGCVEGLFTASPASADHPPFPALDFLECCYLCRKKLQGKDIYIYRGEKAFCSPDCRHQQIVSDERQENCRSEGWRTPAAAPPNGAVMGWMELRA